MTAKIIAVANMKGGVGKTATVVSLAEAFAASGARVLVIDLDAQANASVCIAGDTELANLMKRKRTIEGFLDDQLLGRKKMKLADCVRGNISPVHHLGKRLALSVLPSSPELRTFEHRLLHDLTQQNMSWAKIVNGLYATVQTNLTELRKHFDYVLIDCAPGISVLTEVSIRLADLVMVPTIPDFLSTYGLQNFCVTLSHRGLSRRVRRKSSLPHVLITRRRKVLIHEQTSNDLRLAATETHPTFQVFETEIPETVKVADALAQMDGDNTQQPRTFTSKWGPVITPLLSDLTQEIEEVLHGDRA
jgi:cellulose biosynthesis protein BcsQ